MPKLIKRECPICGNSFMATKVNHVYDTRKCFKKAFYRKTKAKALENPFPKFDCHQCGLSMTLEFDPVKENFRWLDFQCPNCNTLMICVSDDISAIDITTV